MLLSPNTFSIKPRAQQRSLRRGIKNQIISWDQTYTNFTTDLATTTTTQSHHQLQTIYTHHTIMHSSVRHLFLVIITIVVIIYLDFLRIL
jgi:hypothetical protein